MKRLIQQKADLNARDGLKRTALHYAAAKNEIDMVKVLCDNGAEVDPLDVDRQAPINLAKENAWSVVTRLLYFTYGARGRDKYTKTTIIEKGKTHTYGGEDIDAGNPSKKEINKKGTLIEYARAGQFGEMKRLIDGGADLSQTDTDGMTAVHYVAQSGDIKMLQYLINRGADIGAANKAGKTPLQLASEAGKRQAADMLRKAGAE